MQIFKMFDLEIHTKFYYYHLGISNGSQNKLGINYNKQKKGILLLHKI